MNTGEEGREKEEIEEREEGVVEGRRHGLEVRCEGKKLEAEEGGRPKEIGKENLYYGYHQRSVIFSLQFFFLYFFFSHESVGL